jgi:uncharacterized protein (TIGR03067 family)
MNRFVVTNILVAVCAVFATTAAISQEKEKPPAIPDLERIRGAWRVISAEDEGVLRPKLVGRLDLYDTSKLHCITPQGVRTTYRYELDETTTPKRIILLTDDELITITVIYKIEGDRLTVCRSFRPGVIPDDFDTRPKDGRTLLVFKRDTDH